MVARGAPAPACPPRSVRLPSPGPTAMLWAARAAHTRHCTAGGQSDTLQTHLVSLRRSLGVYHGLWTGLAGLVYLHHEAAAGGPAASRLLHPPPSDVIRDSRQFHQPTNTNSRTQLGSYIFQFFYILLSRLQKGSGGIALSTWPTPWYGTGPHLLLRKSSAFSYSNSFASAKALFLESVQGKRISCIFIALSSGAL